MQRLFVGTESAYLSPKRTIHTLVPLVCTRAHKHSQRAPLFSHFLLSLQHLPNTSSAHLLQFTIFAWFPCVHKFCFGHGHERVHTKELVAARRQLLCAVSVIVRADAQSHICRFSGTSACLQQSLSLHLSAFASHLPFAVVHIHTRIYLLPYTRLIAGVVWSLPLSLAGI